jgi:putative transposase
MAANLKRSYGKGDLHFITFSCYRRLPLLETARARDLFVEELEKVRDEMKFYLIGYVVMPNHVHLLMSEPAGVTPSAVLHKLKLGFSRRVRARAKPLDAQRELSHRQKALRSFWQARFYDFNVYSTGKRKEKLNYMHANPVIRRLVEHPKDWPWSSWSFYETKESGLINIDVE